MNEDLTVTIIVLAFYGGIGYWIYTAVKKRSHKSRSSLKSFGFILGVLMLVLIVWFFVIAIIDYAINIPRNEVLTMGVAAAIIISLIRTWTWGITKIQLPK